MSDIHGYRLTEAGIVKVVTAIPGETMIEKIVGSSAVAAYVAVRTGLTQEEFLHTAKRLYDMTKEKVEPFEEIKGKEAKVAEELREAWIVARKINHDGDMIPSRDDFKGDTIL